MVNVISYPGIQLNKVRICKGLLYIYMYVVATLHVCVRMEMENAAGIWKGLGPRILMIGTLTALQWFIYDSVKVFFRLPRPPPPEMPESLKRKLQQT